MIYSYRFQKFSNNCFIVFITFDSYSHISIPTFLRIQSFSYHTPLPTINSRVQCLLEDPLSHVTLLLWMTSIMNFQVLFKVTTSFFETGWLSWYYFWLFLKFKISICNHWGTNYRIRIQMMISKNEKRWLTVSRWK